jgi:hypothetical protein
MLHELSGFSLRGKVFSNIYIPSAAKAMPLSISPCGTAEQAAEKGLVSGKMPKKRTSGDEALIDLIGFVPGINPRPTARTIFSAACKAVSFQNAGLRRASLEQPLVR